MSARYHEVVRLADGSTLVARVAPDRSYRLGLYHRGAPLVEFWCEGGGAHRRRVGDRTSVYEFRSIEQLRYDFERDAENALDRD
jgi:hypothetical protein